MFSLEHSKRERTVSVSLHFALKRNIFFAKPAHSSYGFNRATFWWTLDIRFKWFARNFPESSCFMWGQAHVTPKNENILRKFFSREWSLSYFDVVFYEILFFNILPVEHLLVLWQGSEEWDQLTEKPACCCSHSRQLLFHFRLLLLPPDQLMRQLKVRRELQELQTNRSISETSWLPGPVNGAHCNTWTGVYLGDQLASLLPVSPVELHVFPSVSQTGGKKCECWHGIAAVWGGGRTGTGWAQFLWCWQWTSGKIYSPWLGG